MAKLIDLNGLAHVYSIIKGMLADKLGKNDTAVNASKVNNLTVETAVPKNAKFTDTVYAHPSTHPASMITGLASVATSGSYSDLSNKPTIPVMPTNVSAFINDAGYLTQHQSLDGYVKSVNGVTPNVAGDVTIAVGGGVSTDTTNTWTVKQTFSDIDVEFEYYKTEFQGSSSATPTESVLFCQTLGNFTLNLSNIVSKIPNGRSTVFSAYLSCFSDGVLTITNAGTLYYVGNASDLALTGTGLLVNILIIKNTSGAVDSIVQASKLEGGA